MSSTVQLEAGTSHSGDLDQLLKDTQMSALRYLDSEDYEEALKRFSLNERVLEEAKKQDVNADPDFVLTTLHNIACCHQCLRNTEESASYLEACLFNLKTAQRVKDELGKANERFKLRKYECRARIQLCALLSQVGRHEAALSHARAGMKLAYTLLMDVLQLCKDHISRHKKLVPGVQANPASDVARKMESAAYRHNLELVKAGLPLLTLLQSRISSSVRVPVQPPQRLETRSALGVQHYSNWIYSLDIGELMTIQPMTMKDFKTKLDAYKELTRDYLLDKVCMLIGSLFCISTEVRLMYGEEDDQRLREAQGFHKKALQIARDVLPLETPLLEHLEVSYQKHFSAMDTSSSRLGRLDISCSRPGKLDTSLGKSPVSTKSILATTIKPRSSSAKAVRRSARPTPVKTKSPAPGSRLKRKSPEKIGVQIPFTDRGITPVNWSPSRKTPREKTLTPLRCVRRKAGLEIESSEDDGEFVLCSSDLYGPEDLSKSQRHVECSVDIREEHDTATHKGKDPVRIMSCTGGN